jgi:UDP-N-acetylglucosamine 1-carboxyvinyltransferase
VGLAAVTRSALRIERAGVEHLRSIRLGFARLGIVTTVEGDDLIVPAGQSMEIQSDLGGHVPKLEDQPWPAFPADVMSIAIVTATQCSGIVLMHEKMFESRLFFVDKLVGMGARIVLCDPHRALVAGPSQLHGATVESPDIRAGMAMLIAALCAKGTSTINNVGQIERGYERIDERLTALGANIRRVQAGRA